MNNSYYEFRAKERVRDLVDDGLRNQALHRSRAIKTGPLGRGAKIGLGLLVGLATIVELLVR